MNVKGKGGDYRVNRLRLWRGVSVNACRGAKGNNGREWQIHVVMPGRQYLSVTTFRVKQNEITSQLLNIHSLTHTN